MGGTSAKLRPPEISEAWPICVVATRERACPATLRHCARDVGLGRQRLSAANDVGKDAFNCSIIVFRNDTFRHQRK